MWIRLSEDEAVTFLAFIHGLKDLKKHIPDGVYALEKRVHEERQRLKTNDHKGVVAAAAMLYATVDSDAREITVDDDAAISEAPSHTFVQAWVMVKHQVADPSPEKIDEWVQSHARGLSDHFAGIVSKTTRQWIADKPQPEKREEWISRVTKGASKETVDLVRTIVGLVSEWLERLTEESNEMTVPRVKALQAIKVWSDETVKWAPKGVQGTLVGAHGDMLLVAFDYLAAGGGTSKEFAVVNTPGDWTSLEDAAFEVPATLVEFVGTAVVDRRTGEVL